MELKTTTAKNELGRVEVARYSYLVSQPLLVAHDGGGMMRVFLLQMFQESFSLPVHLRRLHSQDFFGTSRPT